MGRIRTSWIKTLAKRIIEKHGEKLSPDFESNKKFIHELKVFDSKSMRNRIAGYVTKLVVKKGG